MVVAIDGPVATHLADGMTGTEEEDHALHIADGEMIIMIRIRDAGIALCLKYCKKTAVGYEPFMWNLNWILIKTVGRGEYRWQTQTNAFHAV